MAGFTFSSEHVGEAGGPEEAFVIRTQCRRARRDPHVLHRLQRNERRERRPRIRGAEHRGVAARTGGYHSVMLVALAPIAGHHILGWMILGVIAGALAGRVMRGAGFGLLGDAVVGLAGAVVGGVLLHAFTRQGHTSPSFLVELLVAFVGAVVLLAISRMLSGGVRRRRYF